MVFVRDTSTKIVINTDDAPYKAILAEREARKKNEALSLEINALKTELSDIRELLQQVINGKK